MPEDTLRQRHIRVAREVLRKNKWELTSPDDPLFIAAVEERLGKRHPKGPNGDHEIPDDSIRRAVTNAYCVLLYEAYKKDSTDDSTAKRVANPPQNGKSLI